MDSPVTVADVESVQEQIRSEIESVDNWDIEYPDPTDATDSNEFAVVNLHKHNEYDDEVNILVQKDNGQFDIYEYMDLDVTNEYSSVPVVIEYLQRLLNR